MRTLVIFAAAVAVLPFSIQAEETRLESLTTSDGKTYKEVQIRKVTALEVRFFHATGTAAVRLADLPEELQIRFGYDPEAAAAEAEENEARERAELARLAKALNKEAAKVKARAAEEALQAKAKEREFFVVEVTPEGIIVADVVRSAAGVSGLQSIGGGRANGAGRVVKNPGRKRFFVTGYPETVADQDLLEGRFAQDGVQKIERPLEKTATLIRLHWVGAPEK